MINPNLLTPGYIRISNRVRETKTYSASFTTHGRAYISKKKFATALQARQHADAVHDRWIRLYDVAIAAEVVPS